MFQPQIKRKFNQKFIFNLIKRRVRRRFRIVFTSYNNWKRAFGFVLLTALFAVYNFAQTSSTVDLINNQTGYVDITKKIFKPNPGKRTSVNVNNRTAETGNTVSGYIGHENGVFMSGVTVTLSGASSYSTVTDANGFYTLSNIPEGNYTLSASKTGYQFYPPGVGYSPLFQDDVRHFSASGTPEPQITNAPGTPSLVWKDAFNSAANNHELGAMLARDAGGNVYLAGSSYNGPNSSAFTRDFQLVKHDPNGNVLWSRRFDSDFHQTDVLYDIVLDSEGNIYLGGTSWREIERDFDYTLVKYNPNGDLLWWRYYDGTGHFQDLVSSMAIDSQNNIIIAGKSFGVERTFDYTTLKYDTSGNLLWEARFNGGSSEHLSEVEVDNQNNVYVTGTTTVNNGGATLDVMTIKYNSNGQEVWRNRYDAQNSYGQERAHYIEVDCAGNVYLYGNIDTQNLIEQNLAIKINRNGTTAWVKSWSVSNYAANELASAIEADCHGNVVVSGITNLNNEINNNDAFTIKLNPANGEFLWTQIYDEPLPEDYQGDNELMLDAAGNVYVGTTSQNFSNYNLVITKYSPSGQKLWKYIYDDPSHGYDAFTDWRSDDSAPTMLLDAQGNLYFAGETVVPGEGMNLLLGKIATRNQRNVPFDFDGDGKTDISIFRPSVGEWWINRSTAGNIAYQFGTNSDKPVAADFTGDGKTDAAFFRESTGEWFVLRSEDSSYYSFPFGTSGDIPSAADFDGDGRADAAVFRPTNQYWYILRSSGGTTIRQFGAYLDVPVAADYDGDGKADIAIYRASVGEWWILNSSTDSASAAQFGASNDKPVAGDYTGDGKADAAVFRPSTGEWFILRSENQSYYSFPFGTAGDIPAAGDYDGDGRFDASVFRPSNSTWYLNRSTAGTSIQAFGQSGDFPVPNAFVH